MTLDLSNIMKWNFLVVTFTFLLISCNGSNLTNTPNISDPIISATPDVTKTITATPLAYPTTEPGIPLVAIVNGQGITLEEYQAELERARQASETGLLSFTEENVLQSLIDEVLLEQGAAQSGFVIDESLIQSRLDQLELNETDLEDWVTKNGYTQESFERTFTRAIAAAWMRDRITDDVPSTAVQVHARQILLYNADEAENAYAQLQTGTDFATLASQYDPITSGELGWFPKGYLTVPELDEPIFSLQPGDYTQIIETMLGFHIIQVIEKDTQRLLSPAAYQNIKVQAVENWLIERRSQSDIQIILS